MGLPRYLPGDTANRVVGAVRFTPFHAPYAHAGESGMQRVHKRDECATAYDTCVIALARRPAQSSGSVAMPTAVFDRGIGARAHWFRQTSRESPAHRATVWTSFQCESLVDILKPCRPAKGLYSVAGENGMAWLSHFTRAMHMQTAPFRRSLERAIELATRERVVLMCAEAVSWRCHRSLIADALLLSRARSGSSADVNLIGVSLPFKSTTGPGGCTEEDGPATRDNG